MRPLLTAIALVLLAMAAATSFAAATPTGSPPAPVTAGDAAGPATIPVPEVAQRAEEVAKLLRDLEASLPPPAAVLTIEKRLPEIVERLQALSQRTTRELEEPVTAAALNELTDQWRMSRDLLMIDVETLARRARSIEEALERLTALGEIWTAARTAATASGAPEAVVQRIDGVRTAVGALREQLQAQRAETLLMQDRVAREVARCEATLARLGTARTQVAGRLFERDGVAMWLPTELAHGLAMVPERVRRAAKLDAAHLADFGGQQRWRIVAQLILLGVVTALMRLARRRVTDRGDVFRRPLSAALLVTVLATWWMHLPAPPRLVVTVVGILALVPALRLVAPGATPARPLLATIFVTELLRHLASVEPLLEQQIFLLEMVAAIGAVLWHLHARPDHRPGMLRVLLVVFAGALMASMAGYVALGVFLGAGLIGSGYLAVVLAAGVRVADALVAVALQVPPLCRLRSVRRHRTLLERRAHGLLRTIAGAAWIVLVLRYFGLWNTAADVTRAALGAELRRGALSLSLGDVLVFASTVAAAFVLSGLIRFVLEEDVYPRVGIGRRLPSVVSTLLHYAILVVGFFIGLAALGIDLTKITILAGAFGVGIGLGLQGVVNNLVSGLILLLERRVDVGDAVQIGGVEGQVQHLGMRASIIRTGQGAEVIVPNAALVSQNVANWTLSDERRRVDVAVGVACGTRPDTVVEILLSVARAHKHILAEPAPVALLTGFGDTALRFELRAWTERFDLWELTQSELAVAIHEALRAAGIARP